LTRVRNILVNLNPINDAYIQGFTDAGGVEKERKKVER